MQIIRTYCPLVKKDTRPLPGYDDQCNDSVCRFQLGGKCALLAAYTNAALLKEIAEKLEISPRWPNV